MKGIFSLVIIFIIISFLYKRLIKYPYRYIGYFYPSIENLNIWKESEPFRSVDECREWVDEMADYYKVSYSGDYDYECGKNCYKADPYNQGVTYTCNTSVE